MTSDRIVRFPAERIAKAASGGAARLQIWRGRLREGLGRLMSRVGIPGAIGNAEVSDNLTGQHLSVAVGTLYVRVSVNGRDYYFDRITGRFDGTGSAT